MKIEDLRVGIWVQIDDLPSEQVTLEALKTLAEHPSHISKFNGVELTEDWLLKFGFIRESTNGRWILEESDWGVDFSEKGKHSIVGWGGDPILYPNIFFVHKLQIFYLSLEELELKIK